MITKHGLSAYYKEGDTYEIGVDEAGRGPLFGPVYTAAVVLPKDNTFNHELMRDSKKITSKKKIKELAEYIKANAITWSVQWEDEKMIDKIVEMHKKNLDSPEDLLKYRIFDENFVPDEN